jgi:glycosyltransferase involved in cell wall biosynthesis
MVAADAGLISVVIPAFNRRALIERTLESVWQQTLRPAEVIIVDDGSNDGTWEYLESIRDRATIARSAGNGPGAARNTGAQQASGAYVVFLDSDDLWLPWTLESIAEVIRTHERPAYICGSFTQFETEQELAGTTRAGLAMEAFQHYFATWPRQFVIGAGMIAVRRDVFLACGGFSTAAINLEDHDLSLKLGLAPGFVQIVAPLTLAWRQHRGGVTKNLLKSAAGLSLLMASERAGAYPGGQKWASVRRNIITTHARSVSFDFLKAGQLRMAFGVYLDTLAWHLRLGRLRYLAMFPILVLLSSFRVRRTT